MSIATLKKKTKTQFNNMSVNQPQFSINGTRRSQGYVGQTSLSRSFPITPMRGSVPIGHGGCCGKYAMNNVTYGSGIHSINDTKVVKGSVKSTSGMIAEKHQWIKRPQPFSTTKTENSSVIEKNCHCAKAADTTPLKNNAKSCDIPTSIQPFFKTSYKRLYSYPITKPARVMDQSQYLENFDIKCTGLDEPNRPNTIHGLPM
jgi:hypothetical protein